MDGQDAFTTARIVQMDPVHIITELMQGIPMETVWSSRFTSAERATLDSGLN